MPMGERSGGSYGRDDSDSGNRDGGGSRGTTSRGGYAGGISREAARSGGFAGGAGDGRDRDPFGPNDWFTGAKYGSALGVPGMIAGGLWGGINQLGGFGALADMATSGPPAAGGFSRSQFSDPTGQYRAGDGGAAGDLFQRFAAWQAAGGQGSLRDFIRSGAPAGPAGSPQFPASIDYAAATQAGISPPAGSPLYGVGSPFAGPADVFGGM